MSDKKQKYNERNRKQNVQISPKKRNLQRRSQANSHLHATHELFVPTWITHSFILLAQA